MSDSAPKKRGLGFYLRWGATLLLAVALVWKVPAAKVWAAFKLFGWAGVALATLVTGLQVALGAFRWKRVLARAGERVPLTALTSDVLVGSAYNLILPSSVGGDFMRALRCSRRLNGPHRAWSSMLFERMVGLAALATFAAPGIAIAPGGKALLWPTVGVAAFSVILLVSAKAPLRFAGKLLASRAPKVAAASEGMVEDLQGPYATLGARLETFALSLLYQFAGLSIAVAFVLPSGRWDLVKALYAGVPLIVIGAMVPVTIAGLGLRETLFVVVLGRLGVETGTAFALSLAWLGTYFGLALVGTMVASLSPSPSPAEAQSSAEEHTPPPGDGPSAAEAGE